MRAGKKPCVIGRQHPSPIHDGTHKRYARIHVRNRSAPHHFSHMSSSNDEWWRSANKTTLSCPKCITINYVNRVCCGTNISIYSWAIRVICSICNTSWFVCKECPGVRQHLYTDKQLQNHNRYRHLNSSVSGSVSDPEEGCSPDYHGDQPEEGAVIEAHQRYIFSNCCSEAYFKREFMKKGSGLTYLVMFANAQQVDNCNDTDWKEVRLHFLYATLVSKLSRIDRVDLGRLIGYALEMNQDEMSTSIPTSGARIRSKYIDGKFALLKNLPRPSVTMFDGHAYVSIKECIADLLAHGVPISLITDGNEVHPDTNVSKIAESRKAKRIYRNAVAANGTDKNLIVLFINEWSDGFDPMSSSKGNIVV